jgi:hypothetical protein
VLSDRKRIWLENEFGFKGLPGRLAAYQARPDQADQVAPVRPGDQTATRPTRWHQAGALAWRGGFMGARSITWETRISAKWRPGDQADQVATR